MKRPDEGPVYGVGDELVCDVITLDLRIGKACWTFGDADAAADTWWIALSGNRVMAANMPQTCGLSAVRHPPGRARPQRLPIVSVDRSNGSGHRADGEEGHHEDAGHGRA
ncbi:hypothetical protein ABT072_25885 [Streptomyces sp. NPDC002589]|uniref:hypothetical protein n=1 Tax=Streptomyces sp. NPDC002589 TaxID=3154420 RepID=UPI0033317E4A